jgi:hypothetical protein
MAPLVLYGLVHSTKIKFPHICKLSQQLGSVLQNTKINFSFFYNGTCLSTIMLLPRYFIMKSWYFDCVSHMLFSEFLQLESSSIDVFSKSVTFVGFLLNVNLIFADLSFTFWILLLDKQRLSSHIFDLNHLFSKLCLHLLCLKLNFS